jgi:uncharacterized membrane protein (DUF2068 family)
MSTMQSTDNQAILRLLIALVVVTTGLSIYANVNLEHTLPAPLYAFVHAQDRTNLPTSQALAALLTLAWSVLAIIGLAGLWWCRRWGRLAFTVASLALPILTVYDAIVDPTTLVSNAIESGANTASSMAIGGTLAMIWLGMSVEFEGKAAHGQRGVA